MALLSKLSIKYKLSFALIATGLTIVSIYIVIAKGVFESDKISYVFDSQASRLASTKGELESKFERAFLSARSVIATYDTTLSKPSAAGEQIFAEEKNLLALELYSEQKKQTVFRLENQASVLPPFQAGLAATTQGQLNINALENGLLLITLYYLNGDQGIYRMRAIVDASRMLPPPSLSQSLALAQNDKIFLISDLRGIGRDVFDELSKIGGSGGEQTCLWQYGQTKFLVSEAPLAISNFRLLALTPESEALGALGTLFTRSLIFLLFSAFALVVVSLTLARGLTANLGILTKSAEEIGSGHFDSLPNIKAEDEIGVLSQAFAKMSQEIKRLLFETREKARMEGELKTASLVQERLLPKATTAKLGDVEVSGLMVTSSECGGDWWYHYSRGDNLYVAIADATGHGTPAALITAAARSIFSRLENEDLSLNEIFRAWDFAISSCAQQQVLMTGILLRINTVTGEGAFVNGAHEAPLLIKHSGDGAKFNVDYFDLNTSVRIGDGMKQDTPEISFQLKPHEGVVLYTDGIFSVEHDGKILSERRFKKSLESKVADIHSAKELLDMTYGIFQDFRQSSPLPDDVSIVAIRRQGPFRKLS